MTDALSVSGLRRSFATRQVIADPRFTVRAAGGSPSTARTVPAKRRCCAASQAR